MEKPNMVTGKLLQCYAHLKRETKAFKQFKLCNFHIFCTFLLACSTGLDCCVCMPWPWAFKLTSIFAASIFANPDEHQCREEFNHYFSPPYRPSHTFYEKIKSGMIRHKRFKEDQTACHKENHITTTTAG
jgi:hypothetical protein